MFNKFVNFLYSHNSHVSSVPFFIYTTTINIVLVVAKKGYWLSAIPIENIFTARFFPTYIFWLNLFWYFWNSQGALNKEIGQHITETLKKYKH